MYVQDIMEKQLSDFIFDIMFENSGHLYVCGDVTMANDVRKALKRIGVKAGKMTETGAEMWWQEIKVKKPYQKQTLQYFFLFFYSPFSTNQAKAKRLLWSLSHAIHLSTQYRGGFSLSYFTLNVKQESCEYQVL